MDRKCMEYGMNHQQQLPPAHHNLSIEMAITTGKQFFKNMAQHDKNKPRTLDIDTLGTYIYERDL